MKKNDTHSRWLLWAIIAFGALVIIGQFLTAQHLEKRQNRLIDEVVKDIAFIDIASLDTALINKKSLAAQRLDLQFKRIEDKIITTERKLQNDYYFFVIWGIPLTLLGILGVFISAYKYLNKQARIKVAEAIKPHIERNETSVVDIIEKHDDEKHLFAYKKIAIWGEQDDGVIKNVLGNIKFTSANIRSYQDYKKGEVYHVLIINNTQGEALIKKPSRGNNSDIEFEEKLESYHQKLKTIKELIVQQAPHVCIFYFSLAGVIFPIWEYNSNIQLQARIGFATTPAQIYGNLLNILKYQDHLQNSTTL